MPPAHSVPLEDPHQRGQLEPADSHFALGERADVEPGADRVPRLRERARDGRTNLRVTAESFSGPSSDELVYVREAIERQARGDKHIGIGPQPESV